MLKKSVNKSIFDLKKRLEKVVLEKLIIDMYLAYLLSQIQNISSIFLVKFQITFDFQNQFYNFKILESYIIYLNFLKITDFLFQTQTNQKLLLVSG